MLRPVLLGLCISKKDTAELHDLFRQLSERWGGCLTILIPRNAPIEYLRWMQAAHDVDAFWSSEPWTGDEQKARASVLWRGQEDWGPLGSGPIGHGMLPWRVVAGNFLDERPLRDPLASWFTSTAPRPALTTNASDAPSAWATSVDRVGPTIVVRLDPTNSKHLILVWNIRALGVRLVLFSSETPGWDDLDASLAPGGPAAPSAHDGRVQFDLLAAESSQEGSAQTGAAVGPRPLAALEALMAGPTSYPRVVRTEFVEPFDLRLDYGRMRGSVRTASFARGLSIGEPEWWSATAVEVSIIEVLGADPRLTAHLPARPGSSQLIEAAMPAVTRFGRTTDRGYAVSREAGEATTCVSLFTRASAFQTLLGDEVEIGQSDQGRFQARTSELLGSLNGTFLTQPAAAAGLQLLARHPRGVAIQRFKQSIMDHRGKWPGPLAVNGPKLYAESIARHLTRSGLVSSVLQVKCGFCSAQVQYEAAGLGKTVTCDLCGQNQQLADLVSWGRAEWLLRLAGNLNGDQVLAALPVLATLGQLSYFDPVQGGFDCFELGLTISAGERNVEVDVAAHLERHDVTVVGEVKTGNRFDEQDVENLEWVKDRLDCMGGRALLLFSTAKDALTPTERDLLRDHCDRAAAVDSGLHGGAPRLPLLFTSADLVRQQMDREAPWRHRQEGSMIGPFGSAIESCRRNLGLLGWEPSADGAARLTWG